MGINSVRFFAIIYFSIISIAWIDPSYDKTNEGNKLYTEGKYGEAISKYVDAQIDSPESSVLDFNIAGAQYKTEKYDEAIAAYEKVIRNAKDIELEAKANFNVGNSLYRQGKLREALDMYKRTIELTDELANLDGAGKEVDKLREDSKFNHEFVEKKIKEMLSKQKERQEEQEKEKQEEDNKQEQSQGQGEDRQDQNQGEEKEQDQGEEKEEENNQGKGEEKKDQSENENKEEKEESPDNEKLSENKNDAENNQQQQQQQPGDVQDNIANRPEVNMTAEEASRLLDALQQNEKNNKINLQLQHTKGSFVDKDW